LQPFALDIFARKPKNIKKGRAGKGTRTLKRFGALYQIGRNGKGNGCKPKKLRKKINGRHMETNDIKEIKRKQTINTLVELQNYFEKNNLEVWLHQQGYVPEDVKKVFAVFYRQSREILGISMKKQQA
jgi:hypothetical protein